MTLKTGTAGLLLNTDVQTIVLKYAHDSLKRNIFKDSNTYILRPHPVSHWELFTAAELRWELKVFATIQDALRIF